MKKTKSVIIAEFACVIVFAACGFFFISKVTALMLLGLGAILIGIQIFEQVQRNRKLTALNDYLNRILAGDESMEIESMEEGELSILKTNLFKVMTLLMHQRAYLKNEKIHMANAIADISHQLKTPLTSVMMMNDLLENESDEEKRRELLATQSGSLDRMNWLIQTLLKISKLDAKCVELKKDSILTKDLVDKATEPFLVSMDLCEIRYVNLIGDDSSRTEEKKDAENRTERNTENRKESIITCDINWTAEAIQNIVKNCVEHMREGDTLTISGEETMLYTAIIIKDTGCGIDAEDLPHIFERFYRGKNSSSNSVGIGLALAKAIIEEQKGEIAVVSKVGEGSTFIIKFYKSII
ncbi:MAG: HAMP domain-containing histidine kinase [Lachnospiraceae bacterium]|nr:HAMP domain-containing histidine kinase [Lachnospiraceae bacterium]